MDEYGCTFTIELSSPITEEQWDMISDVDFDKTEHIWFHTKHGKEVHFYKDAIPISFIKEKIKSLKPQARWEKKYLDEYETRYANDEIWHLKKLIEDWKKENETD